MTTVVMNFNQITITILKKNGADKFFHSISIEGLQLN